MAVIYGTIVPATQVRYSFRFVFLLLVYVLLGHVLFTFYWLYECFTGMSRQDYWVAVHEERDVEWRCPSCAPPQFESTRIEDPFEEDVAIPSLPLPDVFTPPLFESPH